MSFSDFTLPAGKKPKVFLGLPRLGPVEPESRQAAFVFASNDKCEVTIQDRNSSLLAYGFNGLYCQFLNGDWDYFALLHADILPFGYWLDTLIEDLEASKADVIHAVVAIKDERNITSTAVGNEKNFMAPSRRVAVAELPSLPPVFGIEDLLRLYGKQVPSFPCLLPNTGVLLMKRGTWMQRFPGFTITDALIKKPDGTFEAMVEPEDWFLGRWASANGVKVMATQNVKTVHFGRWAFRNDTPGWGTQKQDENYLQCAG